MHHAATRYNVATTTYSAWLIDECLRWLQLADRYGLPKWRRACIDFIGLVAKRDILANEVYKREKQRWDRALLTEILEAALQRIY